MTVRAVLESKGYNIVTVEPTATVRAAVKLLSERRIGAVLIMAGTQIAGILSERDVVRVLGERGAAILDEKVEQVMTLCGARNRDDLSRDQVVARGDSFSSLALRRKTSRPPRKSSVRRAALLIRSLKVCPRLSERRLAGDRAGRKRRLVLMFE